MQLQEFFVEATRKAAVDLETALNNLPTDKRNYSVGGQARSALSMVAECAVMNSGTADILVTKKMENFDLAQFIQTQETLAKDEAAALALLHSSTEKFIAALASVSDADLSVEVMMPWGAMTVAKIAAYPYWNMAYHEGQINFIAAVLEQETPANV